MIGGTRYGIMRSMVRFRKILFYFFAALYLVLCPLIIFYALGYIYAPRIDEGIVKTGLIHLESLPAGASIEIKGRPHAEKTPATVRDLWAGTYEVTLSKPGYRSWTRRVDVAAGRAAAFNKVLLLPQELTVETLIPRAFEDLLPVPSTSYLLLFQTKKTGDISVFDWKERSERPLLPRGSPYEETRVVRTYAMRKSQQVLLRVNEGDRTRYLWCSLDGKEPRVRDLSTFFAQGEPSDVRWEGHDPEYLFVLQGGGLTRLDLRKKKVRKNFMEGVRGFDLFRGKVFALRGCTLARMDAEGEAGIVSLVEKGDFMEDLFRGTGAFRIDFISGRTLCFWGPQGEFITNDLPYQFVAGGLQGYEPDENGRKIVLWQHARLGVLDFTKATRRKELFERGPEIDWVYEGAKDIGRAYFVYDTSHVLFCHRDGVSLVPVGQEGATPNFLVKVLEKSGIFYSERTGRLYYLEPERGYLTAAEVLPEWPGFSAVFSELETRGREEAVE